MKPGAENALHLSRLRMILWLLVLCAGLGAGGLWLWQRANPKMPAGQTSQQTEFRADFNLTSHTGERRRDEDLRGKWMLIFFGFTNCPDICPTTLSEIAGVMDELGAQAERIQPLFISIDPERDTPEAMADYVPQFNPDIIGLTGTPEEIEATSKTFKVYYEKIKEEGAPDGYTMGHTSQVYLFDPKGLFVRLFAYGTPAEEVAGDLRKRFAR